jgi:hypothetical protein
MWLQAAPHKEAPITHETKPHHSGQGVSQEPEQDNTQSGIRCNKLMGSTWESGLLA